MKKIIKFFSLVLLSLLCILGCHTETVNTTLRIEMDRGTRTISPDLSHMEVISYRIILTDPYGSAMSEKLTYHSYCTFEKLYPGKWKAEVYGQNTAGTDIAFGEKEIELADGPNSTTINVDKLIGKGSAKIEIKWDPDKISSPTLKLFLAKQGEQETEITAPAADRVKGSAELVLNGLDSGSYMLRGELYSGLALYGGFAEAIRITNKITSEGIIVVSSKAEEPSSSGKITFSDMTSIPLDGEILGVNQLLPVDEKFTATLSILTKNVSTEDVLTNWYLDGKRIGSGLSISVNTDEKGIHRLDAIFSTEAQGSSGSAYALFNATDTVKTGMPYQMSTLSSTGEFTLGDDALIRFLPNGKLIVANNDLKTIYVLTIGEGSTIEDLYMTTYSDLRINNSNITDIVSAADEDDSISTIYFICNDDVKIIAAAYSSSTDVISWVRTESSLYSADSASSIKYLGPAESYTNGTGTVKLVAVGASTSNHNKTGVLFLKEKATSQESFILANHVNMSTYVEGPIVDITADSFSETLLVLSSYAATIYAITYENGGPTIETNVIVNNGQNISERKLLDGIITGRITDFNKGHGFILAEDCYISTTRIENTAGYLEPSGGQQFISSGTPVPFIEGSKDGEFYYIFDRYNKKLILATFDGKYEFLGNTGDDYITLDEDSYDEMIISPDGTKAVIASSSTKNKKKLLLDIIR